MSTAMIVQQASRLAALFDLPDTGELVGIMKQTAFKGQNVTDAQMSALLIVANQYRLNPWTKEIYAFPDKGGIVPVVGLDGWARIINEHPMFDGMDFEQDAESCTCRIYRKDRSHPIAVTEYMDECKRTTQPWQSHPRRMLRHKATIQCARLAFGFAGIYDQDEAERIVERDMGRADVVPAKAIDKQAILDEINAINDLDMLRAKRQQWGADCAAAKDTEAWASIKAATEVRAGELKPAIDAEAAP